MRRNDRCCTTSNYQYRLLFHLQDLTEKSMPCRLATIGLEFFIADVVKVK